MHVIIICTHERKKTISIKVATLIDCADSATTYNIIY